MARKLRLTEAQCRRLKSMQDYPDTALGTSDRNTVKVLEALKRKGLVKPRYPVIGGRVEIRWELTDAGIKFVL